jgi:hypothetical protein
MRRPLLVSALALGFTVGTAAAQTREVTLNRAWSWDRSSGVTSNGYYVGPYGGSSPGMGQMDLYCVDFLNSVRVGDTWTATWTSLADLLDGVGIQNTRFGQQGLSDVVLRYQKAAWLAMRFDATSTGSWGGIHQAIWRQFASSPTWTGTGWRTWRDRADAAAANGSLDQMDWRWWYVVTDTQTQGGQGGRQEYLTFVAPEPETLLLFATGLVAVIGYAVVSKRFV